MQFAVLWQCLEVTFLYEHCLLFIRREAFDRDKRCKLRHTGSACWPGLLHAGSASSALAKQHAAAQHVSQCAVAVLLMWPK